MSRKMPPTPVAGSLIRLDKAGMVVRFDLKGDRVIAADVDDSGIFTGSLKNPCPGCRQSLQMNLRTLVAAMLAPHHAEDAQFSQVGLSAQDLNDALVLFIRNVMAGENFRRNFDFGDHDLPVIRPIQSTPSNLPSMKQSYPFS
jgi:hypothetical protein